MGKLIEGKELRNLVRLAQFFQGTRVFGAELTELGSSQVEALIRVMNRELRDKSDAIKMSDGKTTVVRFDDQEYDETFPEEI